MFPYGKMIAERDIRQPTLTGRAKTISADYIYKYIGVLLLQINCTEEQLQSLDGE